VDQGGRRSCCGEARVVPRKTVTTMSSLDAFVAAMKQNEGTAAAYRAALERAFDILRPR
jgi:hypothetical protein